jgi:uncharacterized protein (DUF983 family)
MSKRSKLAAILTNRCPACHEGDLFESPAYDLKNMANMHASCPKCGCDFKREPGFYFGAAYVSYALTVGLWIAVIVALITFDALGWIEYSFFDNPLTFFITGIVMLLLLLPVLYRNSRSIWIHIFVKFGEKKKT